MKKIIVLFISLFMFSATYNARNIDTSSYSCNLSNYINLIKYIDSNGNKKNLVCTQVDGLGNTYQNGSDSTITFEDTPSETGYGGKIKLNNFNGQGIIIEKNSGNLLLEVNGNNVINVNDGSGIYSSIPLYITGNGNLTINTNSNDNSNAIDVKKDMTLYMTNPLNINVKVGCGINQNNGIKVNGSLTSYSDINIDIAKNDNACNEGVSRNNAYAILGESLDSNYDGITISQQSNLNIKTAFNGISWKGINTASKFSINENSTLDIDYEVVDSKKDNNILNLEDINLISFGKIVISPKISSEIIIDSELNNPIIN